MRNINSVVVEGRLTRDGEMRFSNSGFPILKFSIACNDRRKVQGEWQDEASFFDCVILGKLAEAISPRMKKGAAAVCFGKLSQSRWQDDSGQNRSRVEILVNEISVYDLRGGNNEEGAI